MDTVQTLGATSTVGVAAVGFALGKSPYHHTHSASSRKRSRTPLERASRTSGDFSAAFLPTDSVQLPSRPSSRLGFLRRPQTSSYPSQHYPSFDTANEKGGWNIQTLNRDDGFIAVNNATHDFHTGGLDTTKSSWLRRMSTFSSSRNGSPTNTPRPSTPSMSFSNASNAPILPTASIAGPTTPRNKLVKRMSSQGPLRGSPQSQSHSKSKVPTLRRPATSHQRSATLLQQFEEEELSSPHNSGTIPETETLEENYASESDSSQTWVPYFEPQRSTSVKEASTKRRLSPERQSHLDTPRRISAARDSSPTLLMATSIHPQPRKRSPFRTNGQAANKGSNPTTPDRHRAPPSHAQTAASSEAQTDPRHRERNSFSIADLMPSPSPSTWKLTRSSSSRGRKGLAMDASGRGIASAPQTSKKKLLDRSSPHSEGSRGKRSTATAIRVPTNPHSTPSKGQSSTRSLHTSTTFLSSPLPALEGLSTFDIDLAGFNSSPNTPQPSSDASFPAFSTPSTFTTVSRPAIRVHSRTTMPQPSGNYSDRASTILESDTENSRVFDDVNEPDSRSETIYDSIRTGASVSSHSGIKGSRIENFFDEKGSSHPELLSKNLAALQDNLAQESLSNSRLQHDRISEEEESIGTPIGVKHTTATAPVNANLPSPVVSDISTSPELSSSPPLFPELDHSPDDFAPLDNIRDRTKLNMDDFDEDVCWDDEITEEDTVKRHQSSITPLPTLVPHLGSLSLGNNFRGNGFRSDVHDQDGSYSRDHVYGDSSSKIVKEGKDDVPGLGLDERPKSIIFDWSEQSNFEKSTQIGTSPRPNTVHGKQRHGNERGSRTTGRRPPSALHLRSQSVPLSPEGPRGINSTSQLDAWLLGNKGASEEWDDDFAFDEPTTTARPHSEGHIVEGMIGGSMFVPKAIMERQSAVQGQFGQVKELTMLVDELKRLRVQGAAHDLLTSKSAGLWTEAEGIINLATLDNENEELLPPRSPTSASFDVDPFDDAFDFPAPASPPKGSSPSLTRPRKESVATAKSVLENIHQARSSMDPPFFPLATSHAQQAQPKKLPFDTTSLRDLVTRAGVVTRALKEIVRKADEEEVGHAAVEQRGSRADPEFSKIFD